MVVLVCLYDKEMDGDFTIRGSIFFCSSNVTFTYITYFYFTIRVICIHLVALEYNGHPEQFGGRWHALRNRI